MTVSKREEEIEAVEADIQPTEPFYAELDEEEHAPTGRSCCTLWTLGLLLTITASIGLWFVLH